MCSSKINHTIKRRRAYVYALNEHLAAGVGLIGRGVAELRGVLETNLYALRHHVVGRNRARFRAAVAVIHRALEGAARGKKRLALACRLAKYPPCVNEKVFVLASDLLIGGHNIRLKPVFDFRA